MHRATESILVMADALAVYGVVVDVDRYDQWVEELKSIDVLERDADGRALEVAFRAAAFGRSATYTLHYDYSGAPATLAWHQVSGDVTAAMEGSYSFLGLGPRSTTVTYDLAVTLAVAVPQFIQERATRRVQRDALRELKVRAEALS